MQLRFKKFCLIGTIVVYCASFFLQSNFILFQTWAQEKNIPRVNIVAILVDDKIYNGIESGLKWYASTYVQGKLPDTKALVMPLNLDKIKAYDIYRMMENIYFDGLENVNSSLIGFVMFGNIPLPVVNQDGYVFPTVYPYVDFENQKYVWDDESQYFVPNDNPQGQAEIWHGLVDYGMDIDKYMEFFSKIKKYVENPDEYVGDSIWYEDFIAQKDAFLDDSFQYYRNKIMFGEDIGYQRYSPLMQKMFSNESKDSSLSIVSDLSKAMNVTFTGMDEFEKNMSESEGMHTTKIVQQQIETSLLADYKELFSKSILSIMRENIFAGGRWIKLTRNSAGQASKVVDADDSSSKIQLKDKLYLGDENLQGVIENLNTLMENMVDQKIADNRYDMDIVIPVSFEQTFGKRFGFWFWSRCIRFLTRYDNYYFGLNARNVDSVKDLSIYRGTYRNLMNLDGLTYNSMENGYNPTKSKDDSVNLKLKSIGASYDIFSNQVEGNRGYSMFVVESDLDVYDQEKKNKDAQYRHVFRSVYDKFWPVCNNSDKNDICEDLLTFGIRWWGGASPIFLDTGSVSKGVYQLSGYKATDAWRPIFDMGGFQSLLPGPDEGDYGRGWVDGKGKGPQKAGANFTAYKKYSSPTQRQGFAWEGNIYSRYANNIGDQHIDFAGIDYRQNGYVADNSWVMAKEATNPNIFVLAPSSVPGSCWRRGWRPMGTKYTYKIISSVIKHTSTTDEEINGIDRNRYGKGGILEGYYMTLKNAYSSVSKNVNDIFLSLQSFQGQNASIVNYISILSGKVIELNANLPYVGTWNTNKDIYQNRLNRYKRCEENLGLCDENNLDWLISQTSSYLKDVTDKLNNVSSLIKEVEEILANLPTAIDQDRERFSDVYLALTSLSADEIIAVMENIASEEGLNPEYFYNGVENGSKIGFTEDWIKELQSSGFNIVTIADNIIKAYENVYSLLDNQRKIWMELSNQLKEMNQIYNIFGATYPNNINEVNNHMNNLFVVSLDDGDSSKDSGSEELSDEMKNDTAVETLNEGDDAPAELTLGTARSIITNNQNAACPAKSNDTSDSGNGNDVGLFGTFLGACGINSMFNWLITLDVKGPAIEQAAKADKDFRLWLVKNSVNPTNQADWINQYVQWTNGPGYDSEGAKRNHTLLQGASEHLSGMNILTPDRPIDSPRYVSMQSIAGNEMKFIYPDLFNVEVYKVKGKNKSGYDVHDLMTVPEIKKSLVKYLNGKVDEYNNIIGDECNHAINENSDVHFAKLKELEYFGAIPDKGIHGCSVKFTYNEFVKALGGEKMLDTIAEILYYQSLTNKKKVGSESISEDIELIKESFNLNDKRERVLKEYLTEGNEKVVDPLMVIPMYELSGYEVAYVNSNGKDYIIPDGDDEIGGSEKLDGLIKSNQFQSDKLKNSRSNNTNSFVNSSIQVNQLNDECNIPSSGRLPIFGGSPTWFEGFACWIKQIKKGPIKIKLTFDSSLGDMLAADSLGDYIKNSDIGQTFTDWGDARSKYADDWSSIIDKDTDFDADKTITQMQVEAENHNQTINSNDMGVLNIMNMISKNVRISNSNYILSDNNPTSELVIGAISDIGNIIVEITGTGDGCLKLNNKSLCEGGLITKPFNPKVNPFTGLVMSDDKHIAGKVALDLKIRIDEGGEFVENVLKYTISPSELQSANVIFGDNKAVAGMMTPIEIIGYDVYGNRVSWGPDKYKFTVSQGKFFRDGGYQDSFSTNDFRNLKFYYQAPLDAKDGSEAVVQIFKITGGEKYLATEGIQITQASPEVKLNGKVILQGKKNFKVSQSYKLKSDESIYDGSKLNVNKLQKLEVDMKDEKGNLIDVDSQIIVTSQNGLVVVGQVQKQEDGKDAFFETSKSYMVNGHAVIYYYPTTVAGDDIININIPGLDTRVINLTVLPASLENVLILPESEVLELGDSMEVEIFLSDVWGNPVNGTNNFELQFDEDKIEFAGYPGAEKSISIPITNGYVKLQALGTGAGLTYIVGGGTYAQITVDKHIFPNSGLNVLYLNYFGSDWGNQWGYFSDNNKYVENLMNKSNKVITTTTQLVSEDKIKRMIWKIQPGFKIWNPDNIFVTAMIKEGKLSMMLGGISLMQKTIPSSFTWLSLSESEVLRRLSSEAGSSQNSAFFMASNANYSLDKNGKLYSGGELVGNILGGDISLQLADYLFDNGDNVWNVIDKGVDYGTIVIHYPSFSPSALDFSTPGKGYLISSTFTNGSTDNLSSIGIFDALSEFELESSYKSIQDSDDINERIGFLGDFKNITLFAEGEIVGEATKKYGSEFVINLGDPVLSKKDSNDFVYGTKFDGGIGNEIYVDSEKDIFGTYQIDFNRDSLDDLLVVYLDGTIKLAKNYGGNLDLRNMQDLMRIAISIKEVFVGDVDGNGYDDIMILTNNNQLRAYLNNKGVFDVDGSVACLNQNVFEGEISSTPSSLDGIFQIFVEDMDKDKILDIVIYDNKGYIKVFYGGTTNGGPNYLSKDEFSCDSGWQSRQALNTTIVAALGVNISGDPIFDNSMLHRVGMQRQDIVIEESELPLYGVNFNPNNLKGIENMKKLFGTGKEPTEQQLKNLKNYDGDVSSIVSEIMTNFDVQKASQKYIDEGAKYVDVTLYDNELMGGGNDGGNNYIFAPSTFLDPKNPLDLGSVWKNYSVKSGSKILQNGDVVTVRVTVKASDSATFKGSYGDIIQGPWNLYFDDNQIFKGIRFINNPSNAVVKRRDGNFAYIIDNIILPPGKQLVFEYDLEYKTSPLEAISLLYDGSYPDIKGQSIDGCEKDYYRYVNAGKLRSFSANLVGLQNIINKEYIREESNTEDYADKISNVKGNVNQLPGIVSDRIGRISLLGSASNPIEISDNGEGKSELRNALLREIREGGLDVFNINMSIDLNFFEEEMDAIENAIDDIMKGLCNGFSFGGSNNCKGLPVPFNQAFLAPGKYHLFGCIPLPMGPLEYGLPIFFFPGTIYPIVPIPFPYGQTQSATDAFLWAPGGVYPSLIRIYAAPTLTAQLGMAICMGPQRGMANLPSPISDLGGNCIVFAIKPQCNGGGAAGSLTDLDNPDETYMENIEDVRDSGVCTQSQKGPMITSKSYRSSPFNMFSFSSKVSTCKGGSSLGCGVSVDGGQNYDVEYETDFMGIISLETSASIGANDESSDNNQNSITIGGVDILGGDFSVNKIRSGLQQGLRKTLIDNWLDPQIRYILNQLTKMHINIIFPDISTLIDSEVSSLKSIAGNFKSEKSSSNSPILTNANIGGSNWKWISQKSVSMVNDKIGNPFESLASLMNESNIINISTETLTVKVPMIFAEDINSYDIYLRQWLDTNEAKLKERDSLLRSFVESCKKEPIEKQQQCREKAMENLNSFIEFEQGDWAKLQNQIYTNLKILQEYRNFPFEIYEWIHVIDRYMSEIASLINNTIGYLSYWTTTNSQRFVGYVDAIVLIINIIKTYQLLINFSVERGENCGNCSKDTYDQYSCKLSILCGGLSLPILQIPNFKLPNITIDLSDIDIGLDIVLPDFNFQPIKVNLPELPNLPEPPSVSVNIKLFDLPNIPLLPEPPSLPELPSFIPEVELELPLLPPAPEVPMLPSAIEGIIKAAKLIGKIYCIVKGGFGMVAESSVKAKIEQLTQRTYEVAYIDKIMDLTNFSVAPIHNYGVDYQIDSHVDLQFNFTVFYDYLDTLTKSINNLTTTATNFVNNQVDNLSDNTFTDILDSVDGMSVDVSLGSDGGLIGKLSDIDSDMEGIVSNDIKYVEYGVGKKRFKDVLAYFKQEIDNTSFRDSIGLSLEKMENQIDRQNNITPNNEGIANLEKEVMNYLDGSKVNYEALAEMISSDYDGFLAMVGSQGNNKVMDDKKLAFNIKLFNVDSSAKDSINTIVKSNPYKTLLDNKKEIIDGYWTAINANTADNLGLSKSQYLVLRDNIGSMKNQVNVLYNLAKPFYSTNLLVKNGGGSSNKTLVAGGMRMGSQLEVASVIDPSVMSKGIYEKVIEGKDKGKLKKVVYSDLFAESMENNYYRTDYVDDHDIIFWDEKSIYRKCNDKSCLYHGGKAYDKYYHSNTIKEIPYEEIWVQFDKETKLKIADNSEEVKNWEVLGQSYDSLSFSWLLKDNDAYLMKLVERIDNSYEKADFTANVPVHYVLALPNNIKLEDVSNNKLELLKKKIDTIQNLSGKDLLQVVYYDLNKNYASIILTDIDRKWYYSRITTLDLSGDTYMITSPWSNQVVAGRQVLGDDLAPVGDAILFRPSIEAVVSEGDELEGYVGTKYKLIVNWEDNVALSYIELSKDGKVLTGKYTSLSEDSISVDINLHTKKEKEVYKSVGIDQFGNKTEKIITVSYDIPGIELSNILENPDGKTVAIQADLTQDIDQGNVSFQRKRGEVWKTIESENSENTDIVIGVGDTLVVGSPYTAGNEIALYDKDGNVIALMDPNTAEIRFQDLYKDSFEVSVKVENGVVLYVNDKNTQKSVFSILVPAEECLMFDAPGYKIEKLGDVGKMGMFNGGFAIYKNGDVNLYASPTCHLYSEIGLNGTYDYDREQEAVVLTLYPGYDLLKSSPIKVWYKVKPLMKD